MRIFLTGSAGFIGSHVKENLLQKGHLLLSPLRKESDLSHIAEWRQKVFGFRPEVGIHLAWENLRDYREANVEKNKEYAKNLFSLLCEAGCKKIIGIGSAWEREEGGPSAFIAAKEDIRHFGEELAVKHDISFVWARLFYVYGPRQRKESLIPSLVVGMKRGENPSIKNPNVVHDFVYVGDAADAIGALVEKEGAHGLYEIGSGKCTSVGEIVKQVFSYYQFSREENIKGVAADIFRIQKETGWQPHVLIHEGVKRTIDFYTV